MIGGGARGLLAGMLLYLVMLAFALVDFAFTPVAWERASARVFGILLALLPAFLLAGLAGALLARIGARAVRYALTGAAYGPAVLAFLAAAMPLTSRVAWDNGTPMSMAEAALYGLPLGIGGGLLLALVAVLRQRFGP